MYRKYYKLLLIIFAICWGGPMHELLNYHVWKNLKDDVKQNFKDAQIKIIEDGKTKTKYLISSDENGGAFFSKFNYVYSNEETNIRNGYGDADQFREWSRLPSIFGKTKKYKVEKRKFINELANNDFNLNDFNKIRYEHDGHASPDTAMLTSRYYLTECKNLYELALTQSGDTRSETLFESAKYLSYCLHFLEDILCPVHNRRIFAASQNKPIHLHDFHGIYESKSDAKLVNKGNYGLSEWKGQDSLGLTTSSKSISSLYNYILNSSTGNFSFSTINSIYGEDVFYNDTVTKQILKSSNEMIKIMMNKVENSNREDDRKNCFIRDFKQSFHYLMQYLKGSVIRDFFNGSNTANLERKSLVPFAKACSSEMFELSNGFKVEYGKVPISSNNTSAINVKFKSSFITCPVVLVSLNTNKSNNGNIRATNVTTNGFDLRNKVSNNSAFDASYIAIGGSE